MKRNTMKSSYLNKFKKQFILQIGEEGFYKMKHIFYISIFGKTQFEIECRCGRHSVTKKFMTILQILVDKLKSWKNIYF